MKDVKPVLELHPLRSEGDRENPSTNDQPITQAYYLGMFLVGAYQEVMGNLHNLFGDTNVVHIQMTPKGYQIEYVVKGDTVTEVLGYVQYKAEDLLETMPPDRKSSARKSYYVTRVSTTAAKLRAQLEQLHLFDE